MASGHVNRANRPNTWLPTTAAGVKKTLANLEPSTHGPGLPKLGGAASRQLSGVQRLLRQRSREGSP